VKEFRITLQGRNPQSFLLGYLYTSDSNFLLLDEILPDRKRLFRMTCKIPVAVAVAVAVTVALLFREVAVNCWLQRVRSSLRVRYEAATQLTHFPPLTGTEMSLSFTRECNCITF
jgi:hypothetical protein